MPTKVGKWWVLGAVALSISLGVGVYVYRKPTTTVVAPVPAPTSSESTTWIYGCPQAVDSTFDVEDPGTGQTISGLLNLPPRPGFTIGYGLKAKVPLWVCFSWSRDNFYAAKGQAEGVRDFETDPDLPVWARGAARYNIAADGTKYDRGHMFPQILAVAWGPDSNKRCCWMSNVIPQRPNLNRGPWKSFEDLCRKVVASGPITKLWMISGPVFENDKPDEMIANGVWVPHGTYKIMAWNDSEGQFQARALVYPQDARDDNHRLYLVSIAELETMTHLCFFPELPKDQVERIKQTKHDQLWK